MTDRTYPAILITQGAAGFFATMLDMDKEVGFPVPYTSGFGRYATQAEAITEGRAWAASENIRFIEPTPDAAYLDPALTGQRIADAINGAMARGDAFRARMAARAIRIQLLGAAL